MIEFFLSELKLNQNQQPSYKVYIPTSQAEEDKIEKIYEEFEELIKYVKGDGNLTIMGDWNAIVGEGNITREYGLGERNEKGSRLLEFCEKHQLVTNTIFKNHKRRRYTWISLGNTGTYQLDYIMVR
jgi:exonuclease III